MTLREKLLKMLDDHALFPQQAEAILQKYVDGPLGAEMKSRLNDPVDAYPAPLLTVCWMGLKKTTLEWIDENCPQHWARPMFE